MSKYQKNVQNWQLCLRCQLSKNQRVGLWMILIILMANDIVWMWSMDIDISKDHKSANKILIISIKSRLI